jgi:hypothetical protein
MLVLQCESDLEQDSSLTFDATIYNSFAVEVWRWLPDSDSTLGRHRVLLMLYIKEFRSKREIVDVLLSQRRCNGSKKI